MENCDNSLNNLKRNEKKERRHFSINPPPKPLISYSIPCTDSNISKGTSSEIIVAAMWMSLLGKNHGENTL